MNRCPITYEPCGRRRYSVRGLRQLSPRLTELADLPYSAEEQRREAVLRAGRLSIQGVQPKLSARLKVRTGTFEFADRGGRFLLKPQHATFPQLPENEDVTMKMAAQAGIEVPRHGLLHCKDQTFTYFIRRFDRPVRGKKLATEDFAQLAGRDRETKYEYSMERLITILDYCTFPLIERARLLPRILFNYLVGNEDMHLKNFSLITRSGKIELAPAYDFLSTTVAYVALGKKPGDIEEVALPLRGKRRNLSRRLLIDYLAAERLDLPTMEIDHTLSRLSGAFPYWKELLGNSFLDESQKKTYMNLLEQRRSILVI
ncbi:HipA domain-containing protein [Candidatus Eisenbacteria bacterium]|uniref:HipA domain-containing protein n=1 Tax=Eiseniibacteriota bacterium TaxID=2212470 RepID=A0ABV6YIE6_UNCEI